jgi:hypothetical protein
MERDILLSSRALYEGFSFNEALAYRFMTIVNTSINVTSSRSGVVTLGSCSSKSKGFSVFSSVTVLLVTT